MAGGLPDQYQWLGKEAGPRVLIEALRLIGTMEMRGAANSPQILAWAREINPTVARFYKQDATPWCGLFMGVCLSRAGYVPPAGLNALRALKYAEWGKFIPKDYAIGDIGIFTREGGGHVGLLVGKDHDALHVLGGNQKDEVRIDRIGLDRLHAVVRCPYKTFKPKPLPALRPSGVMSYNEA